jgi:hypothetical protein
MRISLQGHGDPIPESAFPAPGEDVNVPSKSFLLEDGVPYVKAADVADGFTHFEVWCVGACGGRGGDRLGVTGSGGYNLWGGGGGGGGMHRVAGLLADLPDSSPVVVGQAGADADPIGPLETYELITVDGAGHVVFPISTYPNPDYVEPPPGDDGGASSFNGTTCRASGGKGGLAPSPDVFRDFLTPQHDSEPPGTTFDPGPEYAREIGAGADVGTGGEGGCGDRTTAGGGAPGGWGAYPDVPPSAIPFTPKVYTEAGNGSWNGSIGKGGGGSHGGKIWIFSLDGGVHYQHAWWIAGNGGKGSFSFANPSVFGDGQRAVLHSSSFSKVVIPGGGGGAKANRTLKYGSRASGFSPNGCVFLRLYKIS